MNNSNTKNEKKYSQVQSPTYACNAKTNIGKTFFTLLKMSFSNSHPFSEYFLKILSNIIAAVQEKQHQFASKIF